MTEPRFRRIVVALDAVCDYRPVLETAGAIAASWQAELHGLFVADLDLFRVAALPFARMIALPSAAGGPFDLDRLEADIKLEIGRAEQALAGVAERARVAWSFEVVRSRISAEVFPAEMEDLLVVESTTRPFAGYLRLSSRWRSAVSHLRRPLLLLHEGAGAKGPIAVAYDRSAAGERALAAGLRLAGAMRRPLNVLLAGAAMAEVADLERRLHGLPMAGRVQLVPALSPERLRRAVRSLGAELLILALDLLPEEDSLSELLDRPPGAILVV